MNSVLNVAFLISGGGTTMNQALIACKSGPLLDKVVPKLVISSREGVGGIQKALELGMNPSDVIVIKPRKDRTVFGEQIIEECLRRGVNHIAQMGWIPFTPDNVTSYFAGHITNQHPGPVRGKRPGFGGDGMQGRAVHTAVLLFAKNCGRDFPYTEAISHRTTARVDEGAVLRVEQVPILPDDDIQTLQERVLVVEHRVQIETLLDFAEGAVQELDLPDIILPGEEELLAEAKRLGALLYPHG